jgi:hypothetical protein
MNKSANKNFDNITKDEFLAMAKKFLPEECLKFIEFQIGLKPKSKGNRYPEELKKFAMTLYFLSPKTYTFLQKTFCLPSKCHIRRQFNIDCGINEFTFHLLQHKFKNLEEKQRLCTLCADEMSLKAFLHFDKKRDRIIGIEDLGNNKKKIAAKHALTLMIRSIYGGWKQPISFYFVGNSCSTDALKSIVVDIISKLEEIGK